MTDSSATAIRSATVRGKVAASRVGPRTLLLVRGLHNEAVSVVELLLPPGYSARPAAGADVLLMQVLGSRDHLVALGGDALGADTIVDLQPGELGLRHGARQIVIRTDHVEVTSDKVVLRATTSGAGPVQVTAPWPTSAAGLPPGTLWRDGDAMKAV